MSVVASLRLQLPVVPAYSLTIQTDGVQMWMGDAPATRPNPRKRFPLLMAVIVIASLPCSKTQALSIKHTVAGCLEGVFANRP